MRKFRDMKILFAHNSLPEYRLKWFIEMSKKAKVKYIITNPELAKRLYVIDGEKYINNMLDCQFLDKGLHGYKELIMILKKEVYDFYELPPVDSFRDFLTSIVILVYAKKNKKGLGYFWEKWEAPREYQNLKRKLKNMIIGNAAKIIYRYADVVFSPGKMNREYFIKNGVSRDKICFIPDCSEMSVCKYINLREKYNIPNGVTIFLYFGRIIKQKGLDILIEAFGSLSEFEQSKSFLIVAGDGPFREECELLARKLNVKNIVFCGRIDPHERYNYFNQCDVFVHPGTFFEGRTDVWGLTLNEAIQCGKIIIATDAVGSSFELINEKNGVLVKNNSVEDLLRAIKSAIGNTDLINSSIIEDKKIYSIYNSINMANTYLEYCKKAVNKL